MIRNALLASRFLNRPLALMESQAATIFDMIVSGTAPAQALVLDNAPDRDRLRGYTVVNGVAVISISGCLVHGDDWFWWGYSTSYDQLRRALAEALADPEVRAIALLADSPGGEVSGCFDLVDAIFAMRGEKPIWAIVDESAYSACYALISAADRIIVPRTAGTGSIGVIYQHVSVVGMLEKAGIEVTTFKFGAFKDDGYPTTKVSDAIRDRVQGEIDVLGQLFVDTVARNRGLAASKVRAMQAGTFLGGAGVAAGLADEVMAADTAMLALIQQVA
ncbi:S49 family peptidase [Rhizosaccharibacter radicis]|uniref:S49 family peptidase n=1 Tax=Rhizosaccharibacter radicis TaxID=2782605 RepID=A0ABT1VW07_9PROT|nr:S49 family peptidase [Acetobacteraceae bacterium KSS12]